MVPGITRFVTRAISAREFTDLAPNVFASQRNVRFREGEYAVPRGRVVDVLRELADWVDTHDEKVSFPFEVRFVQRDDLWLSPAYQRDVAYVAFHQYHRMPHERWFGICEDVLGAAGGRPHWGKMHRLDAAELASRYPRYADFVALRDELDPTRRVRKPLPAPHPGRLPGDGRVVTEVSADLRRARVAVMAAFAIQGLTFASIVTRLPTFKDRLGLDDTDVLVILAVVAVMSAVGSLVAGSAAQRWGSAVVLRVVLVGVSVGVLLSSYAETELALVITTGFYGVFVGAVDAASNMQGVAVQDRYGRSIMTGFHATWSAAAVVGAAYASLTIALDWSLPWSLGLVALAGLVLNAATTRSLLVDVGRPMRWSSRGLGDRAGRAAGFGGRACRTRTDTPCARALAAGPAHRPPDVRHVARGLGHVGVERDLPRGRAGRVRRGRPDRLRGLSGGPSRGPARG